VFPGAQNTRYEHSLGVLETMRRYIIHLVSRGDFLTHLSSSSIETALVCALLFNITRLPLATVLEELDAIPGHELFTKESLLSEIFRIRDRKANTIPMVIRKLFPQVHIERIENILLGNNGSFSDQDALIYSLLNCSLDVRVVDYVRRDAHHLGLGRVFDLSELLPHLRVYQHRLALDITGVSVAEEIVNLRYTLYNRIYWSRPNRAFVAMLKHVVTSLASTNIMRQLRTTALRDSEQGMITFLTKAAQAEGDVICNDIMRLLSMDRDRLYKVIVQVSPKEDSELSIVCQRVGQMSHAELRRLSWNVSEALRLRSEWRLPIIIDMPKESGTNTKLGDDILVLTADSSHCENLSHVSGIVRGVNESFNGYLRRMRVFVHPDVFPKESEARSDLKRRVVDTLLKLVV
jgi:HD superfamily phosphohydrolase